MRLKIISFFLCVLTLAFDEIPYFNFAELSFKPLTFSRIGCFVILIINFVQDFELAECCFHFVCSIWFFVFVVGVHPLRCDYPLSFPKKCKYFFSKIFTAPRSLLNRGSAARHDSPTGKTPANIALASAIHSQSHR